MPPRAAEKLHTAAVRRRRREDYVGLLDEDVRDFIARTDRWFPPETVGLPIERQRAIYDAMCREFHVGRPQGVVVRDHAIDGPAGSLMLRRYRMEGAEAPAVIVYFHGGGFVLGGLDSHDDICAELCAGTGFDVVSPDYRLAPVHLHPAAFEDCCAAFDWASAISTRPIVLCGESAGGNLAAAVAHARRRRVGAPAGQVLIYPSLGGDMTMRSYEEHADAPMLSMRDVLFYRDVRFGPGGYRADPTAAPLADTDFAGLPPTVIVTAQCDPLSSDGEAYRDGIVAAGGHAAWREEAGLVHSFLRGRRSSRRAALAFDQIIAAVAALGKGAWPD